MKNRIFYPPTILLLSHLFSYNVSLSQTPVTADRVSDFISSYAVGVNNGTYLILDQYGTQYAIGVYDFVSTFYKGYAVVRKNDRVGIIHMNRSTPTMALQPDYLAITLPDPDGICILTDDKKNHFTVDLKNQSLNPQPIIDKRILRLSSQEDCVKSNAWDDLATVVTYKDDLSDEKLNEHEIMQLVYPLYYFDYFNINDNSVESREHGIATTHKPTYILDSTEIFKIYNEKMDGSEVSPASLKIIAINYLYKTTESCMFAEITAVDLPKNKRKYYVTTYQNSSSFKTIVTHQPLTDTKCSGITYQWIQDIKMSDTTIISYFEQSTSAPTTFQGYTAYRTMTGNRFQNAYFVKDYTGPFYADPQFTTIDKHTSTDESFPKNKSEYLVLGEFDPVSKLAYAEKGNEKGFINVGGEFNIKITPP